MSGLQAVGGDEFSPLPFGNYDVSGGMGSGVYDGGAMYDQGRGGGQGHGQGHGPGPTAQAGYYETGGGMQPGLGPGPDYYGPPTQQYSAAPSVAAAPKGIFLTTEWMVIIALGGALAYVLLSGRMSSRSNFIPY